MKIFPLLGLPIIAAGLTLFVAESSQAAIVWSQTTGNIKKLDTPLWFQDSLDGNVDGIIKNVIASDAATCKTPLSIPTGARCMNVLAFDEKQSISLWENGAWTTGKNKTNLIDVKLSNPLEWNQSTGLETIGSALLKLKLDPKNVKLSSQFLYFLHPQANAYQIKAEATVAFNGTILGVMGNNRSGNRLITPYNDLFVTPADGTAYKDVLFDDTTKVVTGGVDFNTGLDMDYRANIATAYKNTDLVTINQNQLTLKWLTYSGLDPLRVITIEPQLQSTPASVPEPLTILGAMTAIGFGIGFKRAKQ